MTPREKPPINGRRALYTGLLFGAAIVGVAALGTAAATHSADACRTGDVAACEDAAYKTAFTITTTESLLVVGGFLTVQAHHRAALQALERTSEQVTG